VRGLPLLGGFALDLLAGDPERLHPVAGFGRAATALERAGYAPSRARGALVTGLLVATAATLGGLLTRPLAFGTLTWVALGGASLRSRADRVAALAAGGDLDGARRELRALCGRDVASLGEEGIARAVVESLAENTSDAVVAALVWGALAGPAGIAGYRAANTLDAMFGHRSERYARFGWAAARLDDLLSWPGARVTALLACLLAPVVGGDPRRAAATVRRDGPAHPSPNAGRAEAAFAGALDVRLGGPLSYAGRIEARPPLGDGRSPRVADIARARRLSLAVGASAALLCGACA
jgi:adenosylcobinamide-phosphate synthase